MSPPRWSFDEAAHTGPEHLDPAYVATYEQKAGTDPLGDLALLQRLGLDRSHTLVDLGAGTGALALAAAAHCRRVVAVDISGAMLDVLRARLERTATANVECVQAGFLSYVHRGEPADVAYSRHALHHLPDFWKAIALVRVAAFLKPGGVLVLRDLVYSFDPDAAEHAIEVWLAGAATDPANGWTRAELETRVGEEHSTFTWLLEPMLGRAGFTIQDVRHRDAVYSTYVCVKTG